MRTGIGEMLRVLLLLWVACASAVSFGDQEKTVPVFSEPVRTEVPGIENVWRIDPRIYSGGEPGGFSGLEKLRGLGVKVIVSVDGAVPDVDAARRLGLRYVHIPIGYDGIDAAASLRIARVFSELEGPIYVHCHHGKHRGPAAAALMARAGRGWTADQAESFMRAAGTSNDYGGLYESVRTLRKPTPEELLADKEGLPERVEVPALVELMVEMDNRFDRMKDWLKTFEVGRQGRGQAGIDPRQEAILLRELTRESARLPECREKPADFRNGFEALESDMTAWIAAFDASDAGTPDHSFDRKRFEELIQLAKGKCSACHRKYRDR